MLLCCTQSPVLQTCTNNGQSGRDFKKLKWGWNLLLWPHAQASGQFAGCQVRSEIFIRRVMRSESSARREDRRTLRQIYSPWYRPPLVVSPSLQGPKAVNGTEPFIAYPELKSIKHMLHPVNILMLMDASQNGGELSQSSGRALTGNCPRSDLRQRNQRLSPLHSPLVFGRSGLVGPPLCGGSAPATPPLLQHPSSTGCRHW